MKTKPFHLHFRYRKMLGNYSSLEMVYETIEATSQKEAKATGKRLAEQRAQDHDGKYWFMGLEPTNPQATV
jgi:hypothetical protein